MRPQAYLRRIISTGEIQRLLFDATHYREANVPYSPLGGMPELEAYQLINYWNISQLDQRYVYALEQP